MAFELLSYITQFQPFSITMQAMRILAIDTGSSSGGLAALEDKRLLGHVFTNDRDDYSSRFFRELDALTAAIGLSVGDFDAYAVVAGPGSFTGLRVGLTAVKAWAEVHRKPIASVSGLHAVAAQVAGPDGFVAAVMDGRRGQVFGAVFRKTGERLEWVGEEVVMNPAEFVAEVTARIGAVSGKHRIVFASPAPELIREAVASSPFRDSIVEKVSSDLAPWVGKLAFDVADERELVDALSLDANYVRRSDAESYWKDTAAPRAKTVITIRHLTSEDARDISLLEPLCPEAPRWGEAGYRQIGSNGIEGWAAVNRGTLTGFVVVRVAADEMEILNLMVNPSARRQKIASRLIAAAYAHAEKAGVKRIYLEVRESNAKARAFYLAQGFEEHGRRKNYYAEPAEDALTLGKKLNSDNTR
jgi:tRNA threonylcarbamoyladenosine biosynthesis protein TsaB